ncbi:MAG: glycosyltransferase family 4 protein [Candidatus Gracilibacteria bacterium]|nr:glycosyltransferase family 4 protein [Candidatus Gracilibacteria bacterium]
MKKIFVITIYDINKSGGLSTYVKNLNNLYLSNGVNSEIVTPYSINSIFNLFIIFISKIIYLINNNKGINLYYFILSKIIYKQISNKNINNTIFHFQDVVSLYYISKYLSKNNLKILTLHGDLTNMNLSDKIVKNNSKGYDYSLFIEKSGYELADKIIAVDERLKNHAISFGINSDKIKNFPNFTDISKFSPIEFNEKNNLRKKYGILEDKKVIFCPRRLVEKNGVIYTIDIINKLSEDFLLIITGEGQEKNKVLDKINNLGVLSKIILTGDISNEKIKDYYCISDMVIIPSINSNGVIEATSISAIESMACGIPVIASNIGGLTELIKDGYNGFLCEEKNIDEFVKKINLYFDFSENEKEKIIINSIDSVKTNFSSDTYFNKISEFIFNK